MCPIVCTYVQYLSSLILRACKRAVQLRVCLAWMLALPQGAKEAGSSGRATRRASRRKNRGMALRSATLSLRTPFEKRYLALTK